MAIISECTYQDFELLYGKEVVLDYSNIGNAQTCEFELPVFAYPSDTTDTRRNDFTTSLLSLTNRYNTPEFYLEVYNTTTCAWVEVAQLTDSTYGEYFTFTSRPKWAGYRVDWYKVYNLEGVGCYRIRQEYTDVTDAVVKINYSFKYNLKLYSDNLADRTTKIKYTLRGGKIGSVQNQEEVIDYKDVIWDRELRLPSSFFGLPTSEFTREFVRYKNGAQVWVTDEQIQSYQYIVKKVPFQLHRELSITMMQCDEIYIWDYNSSNPNTDKYDAFRVIPTSNYEPNWTTYTPYASVQLTFKPYFENLRRKRC